MKIWLKAGSEKQVRRHHPWIFSGAIQKVEGKPGNGDVVEVLDHASSHVGWGFYSPNSQIRVRLASWSKYPDQDWFQQRLTQAILRRRELLAGGTTTLRLVFSEADGIPGLIADLLDKTLILQADTAGAERLVDDASTLLEKILTPYTNLVSILEKSDGDGRSLEGLAPKHRLLKGIQDPFTFHENGLVYAGTSTQKTGHYCDLREVRLHIRSYCRGKSVLDGFCHTGGMGLNALAAGARSVCFIDQSETALDLARQNVQLNHFQQPQTEFLRGDVFDMLRQLQRQDRKFDVVLDGFCHTGGMGLNALAAGARSVCFIDQSETALDLARQNVQLNHFQQPQTEFLRGDVFDMLRQLQRQDRKFDVVILDPPKLAARKEHVPKALKAYKDLALNGFKLLTEAGLLALFSCSASIQKADLVTACTFAAWDLGINSYVVDEFRQSSCHPVSLYFPQSQYLCGILVQKGEILL